MKDAGGRNIDDESCAPTADQIIRQAANYNPTFQTIHKRRQREVKEGTQHWCERSKPALSTLEKEKVIFLKPFTPNHSHPAQALESGCQLRDVALLPANSLTQQGAQILCLGFHSCKTKIIVVPASRGLDGNEMK